jgi:hypothetical protein
MDERQLLRQELLTMQNGAMMVYESFIDQMDNDNLTSMILLLHEGANRNSYGVTSHADKINRIMFAPQLVRKCG